MVFAEFEKIISTERLKKYVYACKNDTRQAMTLYRYSLKLSKEMFVVIGVFEVSLRNRIDSVLKTVYGNDWLRDFVVPGGVFYSDSRVDATKKIIIKAYNGLKMSNTYSHSKLLSEMEFGIWKYMFNNVQYRLSGRCLLKAFPNKPKSSVMNQYDNTYIFNGLDRINIIRNRIAHHEPICFNNSNCIDIQNVMECYSMIMQLFNWMDVDSKALLYGLDHVDCIRKKIFNKFFAFCKKNVVSLHR